MLHLIFKTIVGEETLNTMRFYFEKDLDKKHPRINKMTEPTQQLGKNIS